jgi:hypothetical protein
MDHRPHIQEAWAKVNIDTYIGALEYKEEEEEEEEEEEKPTKKGKSKSKDGDDSSPAISTLIRTITCKNFKLDEDQVVEKAKEILGKNMKEAAARLWYKRTRNVISTLQELGKL